MNASSAPDLPSCVVKGRHFVQHGRTWVDTEVEKLPHAKRIRVRFDSREYFELLIKHPETMPLITAARNVQLAVDNTVYEIFE